MGGVLPVERHLADSGIQLDRALRLFYAQCPSHRLVLETSGHRCSHICGHHIYLAHQLPLFLAFRHARLLGLAGAAGRNAGTAWTVVPSAGDRSVPAVGDCQSSAHHLRGTPSVDSKEETANGRNRHIPNDSGIHSPRGAVGTARELFDGGPDIPVGISCDALWWR